MADLLLHWLNHELKLSTQVTNVETDFSSGYLLGEILYRLNHQHNFGDFMRGSSADAKILNFCLLEPTLRNLNVKFDLNVATAIMNEKKGAAVNLLYQIKIAATRVGRTPGVSSKSLERTGVVPLHNRPVKLAKPTYDFETHRLFEYSIRRRARSSTSLQQEKSQLVDAAKEREALLAKKREQSDILAATKAERLHRAYIRSNFIKEALEETDSPAWRLALEKKNAREQRRAVFVQQLVKNREKAEENLTFSLRQKVRDDLDDFDAQCGSKVKAASSKVLSRKSIGYGLRSLTTALNASSDKSKYSTLDLAESSMNDWEHCHANVLEMESATGVIQHQRQEREKRKGNLSRRRKRFVQECVYAYSRMGTARVASILENAVLRDTNIEEEMQGSLDRIFIYKEVARENRSMRDQEYANQEESDLMAAIDRDTGCYHDLLLRFEDDNEMQIIQRNNVRESVEMANHFLSEDISRAVTMEMVEFVLFIAGKREESLHSRDPAVFMAAETWNEYKVEFTNGLTLGQSVAGDTNHRELVDSHELEHYLSNFRPVHTTLGLQSISTSVEAEFLFPGATDVIEECFVLGEEIKSLRWIAHSMSACNTSLENGKLGEASTGSSLPVVSGRAPRPLQQLRLLVFGPPFAGKKTYARLFGEAHNLAVLSADELIENAIQKSDKLGQQVESLLANGKEVPPELYSRLVVEFIADIEAQSLIQGDSSSKTGWVIYGLPATERHSRNLEEHLTGYVDPASTASPYDYESVIAPGYKKPALSPTFLHGKSGIDLVFHIDCPMGTILDRCLGSVKDCATGDKHHLIFDPPPDDSTVRHRLQHVNTSAYSSELLSLHCVAIDGFSHDHKSWHAKFKTLYEPCSTAGMSVNEVHEVMTNVVNQLLKERQDEVESNLRRCEAKEQILMANEDERQKSVNLLDLQIDEANACVAKAEASLVEAEEAKAKKEEILELRQKLDGSRRQRDNVMAGVERWIEEEKLRRSVSHNKYSGELVPATAQALIALWNDMEAEYVSTMKQSFALLRGLRHRVTKDMQTMTSEFCEFIRRPDLKQELVNAFQKQFNEVIDEMRFDDQTKIELHARADVLQDDLESLIEAKAAENDEELNSIVVGSGWTEDACLHAATIYQIALQAECDRFRVSIQLLVNGHYAASSDRSQLDPIMEVWQSLHLELTCKMYRDPVDEVLADSAPASVVAGKTVQKGKAKASVPAVVTPVSAAASIDDGPVESLAMTESLAEYTQVIQRCRSWMEAISSTTKATSENVVDEDTSENQEAVGHVCRMNLLNGIKYEHEAMERRVRFLHEAVEKCCNDIMRSMHSIETILRDALRDRKDHEQAAVAAVIEYIRTAIEADVALPAFVNVSPEFVDRFPTTAQLRQDALVCVNERIRLLPRSPPHATPVLEDTHELLLNLRQHDSLLDVLTSQTIDNSGLLPLLIVVETITALTSLPDALPDVWRRCPAHVIAEIASAFTVEKSALVDVKALLTAMLTRDDLLAQFQADEAREDAERHQQLELRLEEEQQRVLLQQQEHQGNEQAVN